MILHPIPIHLVPGPRASKLPPSSPRDYLPGQAWPISCLVANLVSPTLVLPLQGHLPPWEEGQDLRGSYFGQETQGCEQEIRLEFLGGLVTPVPGLLGVGFMSVHGSPVSGLGKSQNLFIQ